MVFSCSSYTSKCHSEMRRTIKFLFFFRNNKCYSLKQYETIPKKLTIMRIV